MSLPHTPADTLAGTSPTNPAASAAEKRTSVRWKLFALLLVLVTVLSLVPGLAILVAAIAIGVGLRRWRRTRDPEPPEEPSAEDEERLRRDLAGYEL